MSTTAELPETLSPNFTYDPRPVEEWAVIPTSMCAEWVGPDVLVPAPYTSEAMADVNRWAVVVTWDDGETRVIGGVIQAGPRTFEAFRYDDHGASHSHGTFRAAIQAAAYMVLTTEY